MEVSGKQISCFDTTVQIRSAKGSNIGMNWSTVLFAQGGGHQ